MRGTSALILRLHDPFIDLKETMAAANGEKTPDTSDQIIHVQGHQVGTSENASKIRLQEMRSGKKPLSRSNRNKEIRKGAKPYLSAKTANVVIQRLMAPLTIPPAIRQLFLTFRLRCVLHSLAICTNDNRHPCIACAQCIFCLYRVQIYCTGSWFTKGNSTATFE